MDISVPRGAERSFFWSFVPNNAMFRVVRNGATRGTSGARLAAEVEAERDRLGKLYAREAERDRETGWRDMEIERLREIIASHERDNEIAAGECLVPIPHAGTPWAQLLRANVLLRRERDRLRAVVDAARLLVEFLGAVACTVRLPRGQIDERRALRAAYESALSELDKETE